MNYSEEFQRRDFTIVGPDNMPDAYTIDGVKVPPDGKAQLVGGLEVNDFDSARAGAKLL
jgi:hypothetical protein